MRYFFSTVLNTKNRNYSWYIPENESEVGIFILTPYIGVPPAAHCGITFLEPIVHTHPMLWYFQSSLISSSSLPSSLLVMDSCWKTFTETLPDTWSWISPPASSHLPKNCLLWVLYLLKFILPHQPIHSHISPFRPRVHCMYPYLYHYQLYLNNNYQYYMTIIIIILIKCNFATNM